MNKPTMLAKLAKIDVARQRITDLAKENGITELELMQASIVTTANLLQELLTYGCYEHRWADMKSAISMFAEITSDIFKSGANEEPK